MKIDNSPARGMRDLLPADVAVRDHVLESISAVYRRFGCQRIETPALENIERLTSGEGGDNEKLIFQVLRRGLPPEVAAGTPLRELVDLGLRYDLTVPLTRFYGNNHASLPMPFRSPCRWGRCGGRTGRSGAGTGSSTSATSTSSASRPCWPRRS